MAPTPSRFQATSRSSSRSFSRFTCYGLQPDQTPGGHFAHANLADRVRHGLPLRDQNFHLPQLRNDLLYRFLAIAVLLAVNAARNGHDFPRLIDKRVPGVAAVIDDVVEGFESSVRQPVLPHELPDIFLAVEFRRAWRKLQERLALPQVGALLSQTLFTCLGSF